MRPTTEPLASRTGRLTALIVLLASSSFLQATSPRATDAAKVGGVALRCAPPIIDVVDKEYSPGRRNFNREVVANAFAVYAAASYDAYEPRDDGQSRAFRFDDAHPDLKGDPIYGKTGWRRSGARHSNRSGLSYDVYYRDSPDALAVLVAYRGTDGWLDVDLISNLSWLTQWLNPWDQYRQARAEFGDVMRKALTAAGGRPITFVVTGHSLGGGLAQYVAHTHPCTAAVVFNSSFVTNTMLTTRLNDAPRIIRIYVKGDFFEMTARLHENTREEAVYRFERRPFAATSSDNPEIVYQHNMEAIAAVMSRMAIACTKTKECEISDGAPLARTLYCSRYWGYRWTVQAGLKERARDSICR